MLIFLVEKLLSWLKQNVYTWEKQGWKCIKIIHYVFYSSKLEKKFRSKRIPDDFLFFPLSFQHHKEYLKLKSIGNLTHVRM